jgi:hypothetical protein
LISEATNSVAEDHTRALIGLLLILVGVVLGVIGSVMVASQPSGAENNDA